MLGEIEEEWAKEYASGQKYLDAKPHYREAAAAYQVAANTADTPMDRANWLWRSVRSSLHGQDQAPALAGLSRLLEVETDPSRLGEGWFLLAQLEQDRGKKAAARAAYHKCVEHPTLFAFRARYQLALDQIEEGKLDEAEASLKQNLDLMREIPEEEAYEKTLFSLSGLLYHRGDYRTAALRLQEVLDRYPNNPRTTQARLQLSECYRQLAVQANHLLKPGQKLTLEARTHYREQYRLFLEKAAAAYEKLVEELAARAETGSLAASESSMLNQAAFALADCRFDLGDYKEALKIYDFLAQRHPKKPEQLTALSQLWRCYWALDQVDKARQIAQQVAAALKELDETTFKNQQDHPIRKEWQQWLDWAAKQEPSKPISPIRGVDSTGAARPGGP
jgi:TolA-binding protein